eukprot:8314895-Karenia_brevis.AAC.1
MDLGIYEGWGRTKAANGLGLLHNVVLLGAIASVAPSLELHYLDLKAFFVMAALKFSGLNWT